MIVLLLLFIMMVWYQEISLLSQASTILVVNLIRQCWSVDTHSSKQHLSALFCVVHVFYLYPRKSYLTHTHLEEDYHDDGTPIVSHSKLIFFFEIKYV